MTDSLRDTLQNAEPEVGIPGMRDSFDRWSQDVQNLAESVWPRIAERVVQEYATKLLIDADYASPIEQRLYFALQSHYIGEFMNYPHATELMVRKKVSEISALLESKGQPPLKKIAAFWDYEVDLFLYLDFYLVDVSGGFRRCPPFFLAIECDGFAYHGDKQAFQRDRRKDVDLKIQGLDVVRFTGRQINKDVDACVRRVDELAAAHIAKVKSYLERCV